MRIGIMQPYFFPYIGYWQLTNAVDIFVIYDNIQYTKKGWINRNRYLVNNTYKYFTIPIKGDSDYLDIIERQIADEFWRGKMLHQLDAAYKKAPFFIETFSLIEKIYNKKEKNLFLFLKYCIEEVAEYLSIETDICISSDISQDRSVKNEERVICLCKEIGADIYVNPCGGTHLYHANKFKNNGMTLQFLFPVLKEYKQFNNKFIEGLSIIDVLMFCGREKSKEMLDQYTLT